MSDPRLQDLENQYRKEKEEADLLLEQQRLVRGKLGYNRVEPGKGLVGAQQGAQSLEQASGDTAGWTKPEVS